MEAIEKSGHAGKVRRGSPFFEGLFGHMDPYRVCLHSYFNIPWLTGALSLSLSVLFPVGRERDHVADDTPKFQSPQPEALKP